jgi:hypothetical protein
MDYNEVMRCCDRCGLPIVCIVSDDLVDLVDKDMDLEWMRHTEIVLQDEQKKNTLLSDQYDDDDDCFFLDDELVHREGQGTDAQSIYHVACREHRWNEHAEKLMEACGISDDDNWIDLNRLVRFGGESLLQRPYTSSSSSASLREMRFRMACVSELIEEVKVTLTPLLDYRFSVMKYLNDALAILKLDAQ